MTAICYWTPEWQTAIATWALFVVTLGAVIVGGFAATSAARSYALEAEPVVVVREWTVLDEVSAPSEKSRARLARVYVVAPKNTLAEGMVLRPFDLSIDDPNHGKTGYVENPPEKPQLMFAVRNVGRSPAVDVEINWKLRTPIFLGKPDLNNIKATEQTGGGVIRIAALPPQEVVYLRITNSLGTAVKVSIDPIGTQTDWRTKRRPRKAIAVVASETAYDLNAP